ncbi:peptide-methionine (S)-S-oxide reductase MsrA [Arcticibacter eurypsychrophilus]|uniref:peptide-methionine (S)-S-oxide reductase MsrA n=1 Tax=Arcticibacter eurypsychrophilus TaxID=1434752 RepID=UPI00084D6CF2|nr:peptide-methionine (S)-S-oxide reductase MsrA [Arcticibacter eurypsychrophilus]
MNVIKLAIATLAFSSLLACNSSGQQKGTTEIKVKDGKAKSVAAFAEGCFWCSEHIFEELAGVDSAVSGYAGGHTKNPTYEEVCTEKTGHAETVLVYFNPKVISYTQLLDAFFQSHDPTTLNQQGPDVGPSYRSAIFYTDKEQEMQATEAIKKWTPKFEKTIVTEVAPLTTFYRAEEYHQNYTSENPYNSYVRAVSLPRFDKFQRACKLKMKN